MRALRQHATTLVLVALASVAAVVVFVLDRGSVTTEEVEQRKRNLLEVWRPDEITELTVTTSGKTARLTRAAPDERGMRLWSVELDGQRYPADEQTVDQYLGTLEFAVAERRVSGEAADRKALGLDAPRISVALASGDAGRARRERIDIGGSAPTPPGAMYAEVAGRGLFVITKQLAAALDVPSERFRTRSFVPYLSTDLSALRLEGEGGPRRFSRASWAGGRGAGFRFDGSTPEGSVRVQADALDRVLVALGQMQAEVFLSDEEAAAAARPAVTVTLVPRDAAEKPAVIELGGACPRGALAADADADTAADAGPGERAAPRRVVAIRREPTRAAACVPASTLDPLTTPASEFLDLAPLGAPLDEIAEVKLTGERQLDLAREEAEWHLRAPEDRRLPAAVGRALLQAMLGLRATRFVPAADARGLDPPRATLRVLSTPPGAGGAPSERIETLEIGAPAGEVVHVRRLEDGATLELPAARAEALVPTEISLRSPEIFQFRADQVRSLRITRAEGDARTQRVRRTETGSWELLEPTGEGLTADIGLASDVADLLAGLKAERWVSADAAGGYGLGKPRIVIEAEIEDKQATGDAARRTARLELGAPTTSGSFARTGDSPAVFVAPATVDLAADRLLLSRSIFLVPMDRITRVTLTPDRGAPVVVVPSPGGWIFESPKSTPPPGSDQRERRGRSPLSGPGPAGGVRDALNGLVAEEAVSLGGPEAEQGLGRPRLRVTVELSGEAKPSEVRMAFGAGDVVHGTAVLYARREGIPATYAVAQARVRPLLEAAGVR